MKYLLLAFLLITGSYCFSQKKPDVDTTGLGAATRIPVTPRVEKNDTASLSSQQIDTLNHIKLAYSKYVYDYKSRVYNWQLISSKILFAMVNIIVLMGLYLSYLQFKQSITLANTKLEIGKDGIKIDSAVIGLIILTISIAFFFLYLKFVFPVVEN